MNPLDQLRDEIANLHLLADRLERSKPQIPTLEECKDVFLRAWERSRGPHAKACFWNKDEQAGLAAVRDLCLAHRSLSHDLVEAADAMRDQYVEQWQAMYENDDTPDTALAYDAARARHAEGAKKEHVPDATQANASDTNVGAPRGVAGSTPAGDTTHAQPSGAPVTYYVGDMSTLGDSKPNVAKVVEGSPARLISPSEGLELRERLAGAPATASYGGIPIVSNPSLRPGEIVAMSAGKEVGRIVDVPPASAQGEVMPGQDNDGVWIDTTPPSSEKTGEERK